MVCGESLEIGRLWADRTKFGAEDDSIDKMLILFLLLLTRLIQWFLWRLVHHNFNSLIYSANPSMPPINLFPITTIHRPFIWLPSECFKTFTLTISTIGPIPPPPSSTTQSHPKTQIQMFNKSVKSLKVDLLATLTWWHVSCFAVIGQRVDPDFHYLPNKHSKSLEIRT